MDSDLVRLAAGMAAAAEWTQQRVDFAAGAHAGTEVDSAVVEVDFSAVLLRPTLTVRSGVALASAKAPLN